MFLLNYRLLEISNNNEMFIFSSHKHLFLFAGRDGTKAFITGEFNEEGLIEDTTGITSSQLVELEEWLNFYRRDYIFKGD